MNSYYIWVYLHILLFVFWIGTDVGVFILGKFAQSAKYPPDQRLFALKVGLLIDRFPRVCFVLIIPVGFHMASASGLLSLTARQLDLIWLAAAAWLAVVFWGFMVEGKPIAGKLRNVERVFQVAIIGSFTWVGVISLGGNGPVTAEWFAIKLIVFAGISLMALGLDLSSGMAMSGFKMLEEKGYSDEAQATVYRGLNIIYAFVVVIYILSLTAGFLGTVKYPV